MAPLPPREPVVLTGEVVDGRYAIIDKIAEGGMGTVFLAEHVLIKRRLALKLLHPALAAEAEMVQRFMNEAHAAGTLGHPNIVEATDMGFTTRNDARIPFIVFEYLEGTVLSEEVYKLGGLPPIRALAIAKQVASALDTAHGAGIVHLDLKSDNVFLTMRDGVADHVKVLDFGISRFLHSDSPRTRGLVIGTPEFMAPEQIATPDEVDGRADIYALGVLLYELLTARVPYENNDPQILLYRIVNEAPAPLSRRVPAELETMIFERLIAKNRSNRFQTMKEAETAIGALLDQLRAAEAASLAGSVVDPGEPLEPARRRRWPSLLLLAAVAGAAGGAAKYGEYRMQESAVDSALETVRTDAASVASTINAQAHETQARADTIASSPVLISALAKLPNATTVTALHDLAKKGTIIPPRADEVIEIFQLRKDKLVSVLRLPAGARPVDARPTRATRLDAYIDPVAAARPIAIATAPVAGKDSTLGVVAIGTRLDLAESREQLARDALSATLVGLGREIDLVRPATVVEGQPIVAPLEIDANIETAPLSLSAIVTPRPRGRTFRTTSHVAFGAAGVLLLAFVLIRKR